MIRAALERVGPLALASRSPQRRAILTQLGVPFRVVETSYEEHDSPDVAAEALVREQAIGKARGVPGAAVLGVDTAVALDGRTYGKPRDAREAAAFIATLAGRTHVVHSGLCLRAGGGEHVRSAATEVTFAELDADDVAWYVEAGEWEGRAGGYAIQGRGAALVRAIHGDYWNVVGLPVPAFLDALRAAAG